LDVEERPPGASSSMIVKIRELHGIGRGSTRGRTMVPALMNILASLKVILFFVVFLPQFIDEQSGHVTLYG
jgi:hypothetical protein